MRDRVVGPSRSPARRSGAALLALALASPLAAQSQDELRILGFRRQLGADSVELILACSGPVAFRYSSPTLETIRLVLPGVDPEGVTPPTEAWGQDLSEVSLAVADGDEAPGAVLVLELKGFRPYSISAADDELRIVLEAPAEHPLEPAPTSEPEPAPVSTSLVDAAPPVTEPPVPEDGEGAAHDPVPLTPVAPPGPVAPLPGPEPAGADPAPDPAEAAPAVEPDFFEDPAPPPPAVSEPEPARPDSPPLLAPVDDGTPPATRVFEVVRDDRNGALALRVPTDGRPSYQAFFTQDGPERLVLDFEGTESRPLFQELEVGVGPVRRVRVAQHEAEPVPIVRIVIDLDERVSHRIETDPQGLTIRFDGVSVEP